MGKTQLRKIEHGSRILVIMVVLSLTILSQITVSEPVDTDNSDGTRLAVWSFDIASDYILDNVTIEHGNANLSLYESSWLQETSQDLSNGMQIENLDISPDGDLTLSLTPNTELVKNGGFSEGEVGGSAYNWTSEIVENVSSYNRQLDSIGGFFDDGYCWQNRFVDASGTEGYVGYEWLNQSFYLPSVPLSTNISAFHNFTNNSHTIDPGSLAEIHITNLSTGSVFKISSTAGFVNETYSEYENIYSINKTIFQGPGFYNITLYTFTNSTGNVSHTHTSPPAGIWNYWDNASIIFSAHESEGSYISDVFDAGSYAMWEDLSWSEDLPAGTDIVFHVRTGNTSVPTDSVWSDWSAPLSNAPDSDLQGIKSRYIQYMVNFTTASTDLTPVLNSVNISYQKYYMSGTVETFDLSPGNVTNWGFFSYSEETNDQVLAYEYSIDSGAIWHDIPSDGDLREIETSTGSSIRFRTILNTTDTVITPVINEMKLLYVSENPIISLEGVWSKPMVEGGETNRLTVFFNNTAQSTSTSVWLTIYLDPSLIYITDGADSLDSFSDQEWDNTTGIYKYHFTGVVLGANSLWIDTEAATGLDDMTSLSAIIAVEYQDPLANRVESFLADIPYTMISPKFNAKIMSDVNTLDVGDAIHYQILINNTGRGSSPISWMNGTMDEKFEYINSSGGVFDGTNITWQMGAITGNANRTLHLNVSLRDNAIQDATVPSVFSINYSDSSGYMRKTSSNTHGLICRLTSDLSLEIITQAVLVNPGENFVVTVYFNNSGYGSASSISIRMEVPEHLLLDASSVPWTEAHDEYIWTFTDITPGPHSFTITFITDDITGHTEVSELTAYMDSTDPVLGKQDVKVSGQIDITTERIIPFSEKIYWPWSGLLLFILLSIFTYILWNKYKPAPPNIDDAFLIYKDGRLISHQKSHEQGKMRAELDGDIVSAMLTAVQQFVNDSLDETGAEKMRKLEFGDRELFMARGENIYIAIMFSGTLTKKLDGQITELISQIENEFPELKVWNGRMKGLEKIDDYLMALIMDWQRVDEDSNGNGKNVEKMETEDILETSEN